MIISEGVSMRIDHQIKKAPLGGKQALGKSNRTHGDQNFFKVQNSVTSIYKNY